MKRSLTIGVLALAVALGVAGCATTPVATGSANTTADGAQSSSKASGRW